MYRSRSCGRPAASRRIVAAARGTEKILIKKMSKISFVGLSALSLRFMAADPTLAAASVYFLTSVRGLVEHDLRKHIHLINNVT